MLALAPSLQSHSSHNTAVSKSASRSKPSRRPNSSSASASASSSSSSFPSSSSTAPPATATAPPTRPPAVASNSQPGPSAPLRRETVRQDSSCPPIQPPQPQQQPQHAPPPPTVDPTPSSDTPPTAFDIHAYPTNDLLRLLALLLNQIATANDSLSPQSMMQSASDASPSMSRTSSATTTDHPPIWYTLTTASRSALSSPTSHLTFHARNVPSISLESYLLRILRYCPTTNEVFLSLLVYFDRMSKLAQEATGSRFAIDSYNVHRLVIAGVTVASKFFSDVFYTNSRYAKVGGLPQAELNQLELQFLLLNDFNLVIPAEEMRRYAEQLILFSQSQTGSGAESAAQALPRSVAPRTSPPPAASPTPSRPMQSMGAFDAYGGSVAPESRPKESGENDAPHNTTPRRSASAASFASFINTDADVDDRADDARGNETASLASDTDTDAETDDEPTIRPAHSCASSETHSLYSEDGDEDDVEVSHDISPRARPVHSRHSSMNGMVERRPPSRQHN